MHIITRKHLAAAANRNPDAAKELQAWVRIVEAVHWRSFANVRSMFPDADKVGDYVVFHLLQKRYRLMTIIHYATIKSEMNSSGHVYLGSFLTPKDYDNPNNWDWDFGA